MTVKIRLNPDQMAIQKVVDRYLGENVETLAWVWDKTKLRATQFWYTTADQIVHEPADSQIEDFIKAFHACLEDRTQSCFDNVKEWLR